MAESTRLASSLLALISTTYKSIAFLYEETCRLQSQRKTIKDVLADLDALVKLLTTINKRAQQPSEVAKLEPIREPLKCCDAVCKELHEMLAACAKRSKDSQAVVREWLSMRYRGKSFDDMKKRLSSYKATLIITFRSVNIQGHSVTQEELLDLGGLIGGAKEDLEDQLEQLRETFTTADASLRDILKNDQAHLQSSLDSIAQARRISNTILPKINIVDNRAGHGSLSLWGTDTIKPTFDLTVARNEIGVGAVSSAGTYSPETLRELMKHHTPDFALVFQELQTKSPNARGDEMLHSMLNVISGKRNQEASYVPAPGLLTRAEGSDSVGLQQPTMSRQPLIAGLSRSGRK